MENCSALRKRNYSAMFKEAIRKPPRPYSMPLGPFASGKKRWAETAPGSHIVTVNSHNIFDPWLWQGWFLH